MRIPRVATALAVLLGTLTPGLGAQGVLTISLAGASSAPITAISGGHRVALGEVTPTGPLSVDLLARINAVKGQEVRTYDHLDQAGNHTVVLVADGESDSRCERARRGEHPGERCELIAVLRAGETTMLGLNATGGILNAVTKTPLAHRWRVGLEYGQASFTKLEDVACDMQAIAGLTGCTADDGGSWYGGYLEYQVLPRLSLSASYHRAAFLVDQDYGSTAVRHDVSVNVLSLRAQVDLLPGPVVPFLFGGPAWYDNQSDFGPIPILDQVRSDGGFRFGGGAGFRYEFDPWGIRGSATYDTGGSDDADTGLRWAAGAYIRF